MSTSRRSLIDPDKLQAKRIRARLTQKGLAERTGLHQTYISFLERGERGGSPESLGILADALGCDIADLTPEGLLAA